MTCMVAKPITKLIKNFVLETCNSEIQPQVILHDK